jgi:hypothetical protein
MAKNVQLFYRLGNGFDRNFTDESTGKSNPRKLAECL